MIIAIDTEELDRVEIASKFVGGEGLDIAIELLLYYSKEIQEYFNEHQKELAEYGCLRNPIIIEDDDFIKHLNKRKIK